MALGLTPGFLTKVLLGKVEMGQFLLAAEGKACWAPPPEPVLVGREELWCIGGSTTFAGSRGTRLLLGGKTAPCRAPAAAGMSQRGRGYRASSWV